MTSRSKTKRVASEQRRQTEAELRDAAHAAASETAFS